MSLDLCRKHMELYFTVQPAVQPSNIPFFLHRNSSVFHRYTELDKTCTTHKFLLTIFPTVPGVAHSSSSSSWDIAVIFAGSAYFRGNVSLLRGSPGLLSSSPYYREHTQHPYGRTSFLFHHYPKPMSEGEDRDGESCMLMLMSAYWAPALPLQVSTETLTWQPISHFQSLWFISQNLTWF